MTTKQKQDAYDMYNRYNWKCFSCGGTASNRAHLIGQGLTMRKMFGNRIINHPLNILPACMKCNDLIDCGSEETARKIVRIIDSLDSLEIKRGKIENIVMNNIKRKRSKTS